MMLIRVLVLQRHVCTRYMPKRLLSINDKIKREPAVWEDEKSAIQIKEQVVKPIDPIKQELIRKIPVEFHGVRSCEFHDQSEWHPIFKSPYLNTMRRIIKFKVYLTTFSLISSIHYGSQAIFGATGSPWKAVILSTITLTGLSFIGDFFRRLIVQIYVSPDEQYVRLCRFTFFGRRRDMVLPKDCIVRLTEANTSQRAVMLDVKLRMPEKGVDVEHDNYEFYELGFRIPLALGGVLDRDRFNSALGKILVKKPHIH